MFTKRKRKKTEIKKKWNRSMETGCDVQRRASERAALNREKKAEEKKLKLTRHLTRYQIRDWGGISNKKWRTDCGALRTLYDCEIFVVVVVVVWLLLHNIILMRGGVIAGAGWLAAGGLDPLALTDLKKKKKEKEEINRMIVTCAARTDTSHRNITWIHLSQRQ